MSVFSYESPFSRFINRLVDVIVLGLITILCCLPVVTIGAAFSALYYVTLKMARGVEGGVVRAYFKAFKDNLWKGTALWGIMAVVLFILYLDYILLYQREIPYEGAEWIVLFIFTAVLTMIGCYVFPLQAQFENPVFRTVKNSFILAIMNLPRSILLLLIEICPIVVLIFYPDVMYLLGILCIAGIPYLKSEILVRIFEKYMPEEPEPAPIHIYDDLDYDNIPVNTGTTYFGSDEDLLAPEEDEPEE